MVKNEVRVSLKTLKPNIVFIQSTIYEFPPMGALDVGHFGPHNSSHFGYQEAVLFELIFHDIKESGFVFVF